MPRTRIVQSAAGLGLACLTTLVGGCAAGPNNDATAFNDLLDSVMPPSPSEVAREAFNIYDADQRRRSIALLSSSHFGHEEPYLRTYRLLIDDQDPTVRAACVHALGLHGTPEDAKTIVPLLNDGTVIVRWETAKALQKIHNPVAVLPLIEAMSGDEDADVRLAAAQALGQYPTRSVFNALVGALADSNFGVVRSASDALALLTGQDLGTDGADWLDYAGDHPTSLFNGQRQYTYLPYEKPPGKMDKIKFWDKPEPTEPKTPVGLNGAAATDSDA